MQFAPAKQSIGIVFDSDMGNDPEAALALALLNGLDGKNECRIVALSTTKTNLNSAAFLDVVVRFYASATTGPFGEVRKNQPIGMNELGLSKEDTPMLAAALAKPQYPTGIQKFNDTAEPHALIRNMLTAQQDGNAAIVLDGPATNLVRTLELQNMPAVVARKVRYLVVCTAGLKADLPAARKLLADWPTPIVAVGPEIGAALPYPAASLVSDYSWAPAHPIVEAVKTGKPGDVASSGLAAVLYAVRAKDDCFKLSEPGKLSISDNGQVSFTVAGDGNARQLMLDPAQQEHILKSYTEIASAKPVPRVFRRKSDEVKDADELKKQDEIKNPEAKKPETP